jgi:UDPglucose 6-dehydrogenase
LGIAGGNLERDLVTIKSLAAENGTEAGIVDSWLVSSRYRRDWALRKVFDLLLSKTSNPRIAIWGLAYKKDTHSVKNSPCVFLARALASVEKTCYDPQVKSLASPIPNLSFSSSAIEACSGADALLVMTPWAEFAQADLTSIRETMRGQILIDPFGIFQEADCIAAGLSRHSLGS